MGALSDFALKVENTLYRGGSLLARKSPDYASHAITKVKDTTADATVNYDTFTVDGNLADEFVVDDQIEVSGSTSNDGFYTIATVGYDSANDKTNIKVSEEIPDSTADGVLYLSRYENLGAVREATAEWDVNETEAGTNGRTKELSLDLTLSVTLQQTSDTELENLNYLTESLLEILFLPSHRSTSLAGDTATSTIQDLTENGFWVDGVLAQTQGNINFMGEGSGITITIPMRITPSMLGSKISLI